MVSMWLHIKSKQETPALAVRHYSFSSENGH